VATPIVFVAGNDPVALQLVQSVASPGGRLTGIYVRATDLTGKRLELLRDIVPGLHRVVTFYDPSNRSAVEAAKEARDATRTLGLELFEGHVASVEELHKLLQSVNVYKNDAYFGVSDAMIDIEANAIIEWSLVKKLPTMFYQQDAIAKGGLATYTTDFQEGGRVSAKHVQRTLSGSDPANLPVEGLDRLLFIINFEDCQTNRPCYSGSSSAPS
jgi:putative tryptophan/tyrosine transport system substrate-binding protein